MPSPCAPLTSAPCLSSVRSASRSPFIAASATGELEAAARTAETPHAMATLERNRRFIAPLTEAAGLGLPRRHEGVLYELFFVSSCFRGYPLTPWLQAPTAKTPPCCRRTSSDRRARADAARSASHWPLACRPALSGARSP